MEFLARYIEYTYILYIVNILSLLYKEGIPRAAESADGFVSSISLNGPSRNSFHGLKN